MQLLLLNLNETTKHNQRYKENFHCTAKIAQANNSVNTADNS